MDRQQAKDFVIRELGKHSQRDNIIQQLCEMNGMTWNTAEELIQQVEDENPSAIALRQTPLVVIVGITTALISLFVMIWIVQLTLQGVILFPFEFPMPYMGNLVGFAVAMAVMIGSLRGMWDTILQIWNR